MSEYQYYEFCSIKSPLSSVARKEMSSLSSRAKVGTHGASYIYNYGDFRGDPKSLLLKYFDVFFYISNWGTVQLMFKYEAGDVDIKSLQRYCVKHGISCEMIDHYVLLDIHISNEEGGGWIEGEEFLADLLPLYDEIKSKNYQILELAKCIYHQFNGDGDQTSLQNRSLSNAQKTFLACVGIDENEVIA